MKRAIVLAALLASSAVAFAQEVKNPVSTVVKESLPRQQKNLVAAAEEMPADKYDFKPTPQQMSFGKLVMHITESNNYLCAKISDTPAPKSEELKETDGKDKLVAALKASFDFCSTALAKVDDSKLRYCRTLRRKERPARLCHVRADQRLGRSLQRRGDVPPPQRNAAADGTTKEVMGVGHPRSSSAKP